MLFLLLLLFQSIRGTKQYWYRRRGELMCMLRELGPQSLFLTFSCAEYESPDIAEYLRIVNNVPDKYSINKLCKGEVLGPVEHFYWKKEYQARGAPHYQMWCCPGFRKESLATFLTRKTILNCTTWLQGTSCTSAAIIAWVSIHNDMQIWISTSRERNCHYKRCRFKL